MLPRILTVTRFGNPVLRQKARRLTKKQILSDATKRLIADMRHTLVERKYGVGIAAPQVGESVALSVIGIKPTPNRPDLTPFEAVIINPEVVETFGDKVDMWEGCVSCGTNKDILFARLPRFEKVRVIWIDDTGERRDELIEGFTAQVMQHEIDHLNGVLFVDHVQDASSFMMADEYRKRILGL